MKLGPWLSVLMIIDLPPPQIDFKRIRQAFLPILVKEKKDSFIGLSSYLQTLGQGLVGLLVLGLFLTCIPSSF